MPTYSLTLREEKGFKLTTQELDDNFRYLDNKTNGGGGSTTGGYQLLGTLEVDMNAGTYSLTNPYAIVIVDDRFATFSGGDIINSTDGESTVYGTASVISASIFIPSDGRFTTYRLYLTNIEGDMFPNVGKPIYQCQLTGASGEVSDFVTFLGPDQEITLSGTNHIIKDIVLCKPSVDLTGSGDLQIYTEELRGGDLLVNTLEGEPDYLSLLTSSNTYLNYDSGILSKNYRTTTFISNTLYVTVNLPLDVPAQLTCLVYGYQID